MTADVISVSPDRIGQNTPTVPVRAVAQGTIGAYMLANKGASAGFDYLRFILSISVLVWHSYLIVFGRTPALAMAAKWSGYLTFWIMPMFFALSGFLIATSLERSTSLKKFLWLRFIRLYPALTVEVILSGLVLGVIATTFTLQAYFSDILFWKYWANVVGWVRYELPGVFLDNPMPKIVNTSLWTVPFELECYLLLTIAALLSVRKRPGQWLIAFVIVCLARVAYTFFGDWTPPYAANVGGRDMIMFFCGAVLLNLNKNRIPMDGRLAIAAFLLSAICLFNYNFIALATLPVAYLTVWLGLQRPKRIKYVMDGDYSYGIYLYAAPIQQAAWYFTDIGKTYLGNVALSLALVSIFATFSWHAIEKPMLRLKKLF